MKKNFIEKKKIKKKTIDVGIIKKHIDCLVTIALNSISRSNICPYHEKKNHL